MNKPRKPRSRTSVETLDNRIDRLETLLYRIAEKMEGNQDSTDSAESASVSTDKSHGSLFLDRRDSKSSSSLSRHSPLPPQEKGSYFQQCNTILERTIDPEAQADIKSHPMLHYKGMHSGFGVLFSNQSIQWIRERLKPEDQYITRPFETLLYYVFGWKKFFLSVWSEPKSHTQEEIDKLREGIFPDDQLLIDELLSYYDFIAMSTFVCDKQDLVDLFDHYYKNKTLPKKEKYKFTWSELMVMSINAALLIAIAAEKKNEESLFVGPPAVQTPILDNVTADFLVNLQEEMFLNTVFYFHRICAINEGPRTIQALLLLVFHLETSSLLADVNYSLVCMASKYAQELGLHRFDLFLFMPEKERLQFSRLWAAVQCLDLEIAYRLGKPPLINMFDVSTLTPSDPDYVNSLVLGSKDQLNCPNSNMPVTLNFIYFFSYKLSQLRAYSYFQLFSANIKYDNLKHVQDIVTSLTSNMVDLAAEMDEQARPRYFYEPEFGRLIQLLTCDMNCLSLSEAMLIFHLSYFYNMAVINRVPCQIDPGEVDSPAPGNDTFRKISLDSSRTMLHIVRAVDLRKISLFAVTWLGFFPFIAVTNVVSHCLNNTGDPDCHKDLSLLIDVSMGFFSHFSKHAEKPSTRLYYLRLHVLDLLTRILLRITVKVYEEHTNLDILSGNPALRNHLCSVEKKYPQFYSKMKEASDIRSLISCVPQIPRSSKNSSTGSSPYQHTPTAQTFASPSNQTPRRNDPALVNILRPSEFDNIDLDLRDFALSDDLFNPGSTNEFTNLPNFFFDNGL